MNTTPRPWRVISTGYMNVEILEGPNVIASLHRKAKNDGGVTDANAALIVRAVNTFDEAKESLLMARNVLTGVFNRRERELIAANVEATLAKMEGR